MTSQNDDPHDDSSSRLSVKGFHDFINQHTSDLIFEAGTGMFRDVGALTDLQIPILSQRVDPMTGLVILRVKVILTRRRHRHGHKSD